MLTLPVAAAAPPSEVTLFKNVNIFDGENEKLLEGYDVLVVKNLIKKIDKEIEIADTYVIDVKTGGLHPAVTAKTHTCDFMTNDPIVMVYDPVKMVKHEVKVKVIDGKGRTLMPGLIDAHWHVMLSVVPISTLMSTDLGYLSIAAAIRGRGKRYCAALPRYAMPAAMFSGSRELLMRGWSTARESILPVRT
jgi:adenine deaminase